jgi:hypothetical protein
MQDIKSRPATKQVNGIELQWSEHDQKYYFPVPEQAQIKLLWDDETDKFLPVINSNNVVFRQRQATGADGTVLVEQVIYRDPEHVTQETLAQQRSLILAKELEWRVQMWETLINLRPFVVVGLFVCVVAFFYSLVCGLNAMAGIITVGAAEALSEVLYFGVWVVGILAFCIVLRYGVPIIFSGKKSHEDQEVFQPQAAAKSEGDINITVNRGTGFSNQSHAQNMVDNRKL